MREHWPTATPHDYEEQERLCIEHEDDPLPGDAQRDWFMSQLFKTGDGWTELRGIKRSEPDPKKRTQREFAPAGDLSGVESFVDRYGYDHDLYFAVAARRTRENGRLSNCGVLRAYFCDIDFKDTPEHEARERLANFVYPEPNLTVRTGGGIHLYWVLADPLDLSEPGRAKDCERRLIGTAQALGGDTVSAEPAHVLRLPGTFNFKYSPAREVTLEGF